VGGRPRPDRSPRIRRAGSGQGWQAGAEHRPRQQRLGTGHLLRGLQHRRRRRECRRLRLPFELFDNFDALTTYSPIQFLGVIDPVTGATVDLAGNPLLSNWFYEQKKEATWQAEWVDATDSDAPMTMVEVTRLDWGDSLLSKAWTVRSKIRLEIRLYRANDMGLEGYVMNHIAGSGIDEVWGAADLSAIGALEAAHEPLTFDETDSIRDSGTESEWPFKSAMNTEGTASWVDIQLVPR